MKIDPSSVPASYAPDPRVNVTETVKKQTSLDEMAKGLGVPVDALRNVNPHLNSDRLQPGRWYTFQPM